MYKHMKIHKKIKSSQILFILKLQRWFNIIFDINEIDLSLVYNQNESESLLVIVYSLQPHGMLLHLFFYLIITTTL